MNKQINIGIIGTGHLGQYHVKHYLGLPNVNLVGIHDVNPRQMDIIQKTYPVKSFSSMEKLIMSCDALSVVTPTETHAIVAEKCIELGKHVFIEKPITKDIKEAERLVRIANENNILIQVGHIERLNPAILALKPFSISPKFVEIQRLAPYTVRGTDVPVVLDLMIHDIDILLSIVNSPVANIRATGVSILTDSVDIAHARLRFENGTVASIVSSRVAQDKVRKIKLFQKDFYATLDLLLGLTEVYQVNDESNDEISPTTAPFEYHGRKRIISYTKPPVVQNDALRDELSNFIQSILGNATPIVDGQAGRDALEIAIKIQDMIIQDIH
ncbi:MAG: Gfo/Idh/MocA family oxidoreductase [Candidatus Marinimicrobia bacterium]|nr:Gfo/Idh/MocA family oxidoreductase [Candidatus Neomarinimicrobiota bacterium]